MTAPRRPRPPTPSFAPWAVLVLAGLAQLALALNPGYFSHDELQWGAAADVADGAALPWFPWTDASMLQWRPLTFNAWLLLSNALFASPQALHSLWVLMGSAIAAGLAWLLLRLGLGVRTAVLAGLVFALNPYAAYVHGWVATLADLLWVGASLALAGIVHALHRRAGDSRREARRLAPRAGAAAFVLAAVALMSKESALVMPALLGLAWLLAGGGRVLGAATLGAGVAAAGYLALRAGVLLAPAEASGYTLAPAAAPANFAAYVLYLPMTPAFEVQNVWLRTPGQLATAAVLMLALVGAVLRASPRLGLAMVLGAALSVAPVLVLPQAATQYGYGLSLWWVACTALAWPRLGRPARALVVALMVLVTWHGARVQQQVRAVGERQAVFQPALAQALATHEGELRLLRDARFGWAYQRLTHEVPAWRGQPIGDRVRWVDAGEAADFRVGEDGA
ncbi:MAG TPA: hypothetical protein VFQ84_02545, partial [Arenimonas sp.]|uniref:hypothetical protein n=1 Tax=Arenimonas sp. TaxID=1872635 RepID=UPI002D7E98A0